jgi:hypothetical protein
MKRTNLIRIVGWLALASALAPRAAAASACMHETVVQIAFARGATQWVHRGPGTTYVGYFKKGQSLTVAAAGGTSYTATSDLSWAKNSQDPWQLTLLGPGGFHQNSDLSDQGPLVVDKLPATGKYSVYIYPCADWGEPGTVMITTSPE